MPVSDELRARGREILNDSLQEDVENAGPIIALNPGGAYGTAKRWLPDRFAAELDLPPTASTRERLAALGRRHRQETRTAVN